MRKLNVSYVFLTLLLSITGYAQSSLNMRLLAHYNDTSLNRRGTQIWNDVVGWHDAAKQREYLISGTTDSIYIFDITDPTQLNLRASFSGTNTNCINRDYYTYEHYLYTVSDQCDQVGHLQIFDLQYLPDSVVKVHESDSLGGLTHTIFIEPATKRMYMMLNKIPDSIPGQLIRHPMDILSLEDPIAPKRIGSLAFPAPYESARVHEAYVRNDTAYCSSEGAGLFIFDVRDAAQPVLISSIVPPYPQNGYNHSNWLDSSGRYLLFCDESPAGLGMKIYDLKDITNPRIVGSPFKAAGSPHNSFWMGRYAYTSMYYGGLHVYDLNRIDSPTLGAFYDTYPQAYTDGYHGCWGVWPYLPSGVILASDMENGLFVFSTTERLSVNENQLPHLKLSVQPNPFQQTFQFTLPSFRREESNLAVYDLQGKLVTEKQLQLEAGANVIEEKLEVPTGLYLLKIITSEFVYTARIIKQ